jgi:hypothetical protein
MNNREFRQRIAEIARHSEEAEKEAKKEAKKPPTSEPAKAKGKRRKASYGKNLLSNSYAGAVSPSLY